MSVALALEHALSLLVLIALVAAVKLDRFPADPRPSVEDAVLAALAAAPAVPTLLGAPGAPVGAIQLGWLAAELALFTALWLDALLFRVFTIELGTGGIGTVVWSALYRELAELAQARRFIREHRAFALFLPTAAAGLARALLAGTGARLALSALFLAGSGWLLASTGRARAWGPWLLLGGSAAAGGWAEALRRGVAPAPEGVGPWCVGAALALGAARLAAARLLRGAEEHPLLAPAQLLRSFGFGRLPRRGAAEVRAEHRLHLAVRPAVPKASPLHGRLAGRSVILVTLESVGRDHLARWGGERGARTPFLDALAARAVVSDHHHCVSPNTNEAHRALYTGRYGVGGGRALTRAMLAAGFDSAYLTTADTADYGLAALLTEAGFTTVIDRRALPPGPRDGGVVSDWALPEHGVARLAEALRRDRPFFLHVHTANTHLPYRVVDHERYARRDHRDDRGRFLDAVEEADAILAALFAALAAQGLGQDALVVVSSDHGQAFGERGYLSHASAVTAPQLTVPLLLAHPDLAPGVVARSSHFDVLPTILDLLGLSAPDPVFGRSLYAPSEGEPSLLVWAGHPSRRRASNFGLVTRDRKYMVDLVSGRCYELTLDDGPIRELSGDERVYWMRLLHRILTERGLA